MDDTSLVMAAKQNDTGAISQLYEQNKRLIYSLCKPYASRRNTIEDLLQEAYFSLLSAIEAYDVNECTKFTTYLSNSIKWRLIRYVKRGMRELSILDSPVNKTDPEGATLGETLPDESMEFEEKTINSVDNSSLFSDIKDALTKSCHDNAQAQQYYRVFLARYKNRLSYKRIAELEGCTVEDVRGILSTALRTLRHPRNKKIYSYRDEYIFRSLHHSGLSEFRHTFTSSVEWAYMKRNKETTNTRKS